MNDCTRNVSNKTQMDIKEIYYLNFLHIYNNIKSVLNVFSFDFKIFIKI